MQQHSWRSWQIQKKTILSRSWRSRRGTTERKMVVNKKEDAETLLAFTGPITNLCHLCALAFP
jgi:hypothetical protein